MPGYERSPDRATLAAALASLSLAAAAARAAAPMSQATSGPPRFHATLLEARELARKGERLRAVDALEEALEALLQNLGGGPETRCPATRAQGFDAIADILEHDLKDREAAELVLERALRWVGGIQGEEWQRAVAHAERLRVLGIRLVSWDRDEGPRLLTKARRLYRDLLSGPARELHRSTHLPRRLHDLCLRRLTEIETILTAWHRDDPGAL